MTGPLYSFDPDTSGPRGGPGAMVMSIACAEWRCGDCAEWFRCDHACHRRQGSNADMASYGDASDHRSPGWPVNGGPQTTPPETPRRHPT